MSEAQSLCNTLYPPRSLAIAECLTSVERPVWQKYWPSALPAYDVAAAHRKQIASKHDLRLLSDSGFDKDMEKTRNWLNAEMAKQDNAEANELSEDAAQNAMRALSEIQQEEADADAKLRNAEAKVQEQERKMKEEAATATEQAQENNGPDAFQTLMLGIAGAAQARANRDAAGLNAIQQHPLPTTQHTTCSQTIPPVNVGALHMPGTIECTTQNW